MNLESLGRSALSALLLGALPATTPADPAADPAPFTLELAEGWSIQAASSVEETGEVISTVDYGVSGWVPVQVPATVMSALVKNGQYPDLYRGTNLEKVPREPFSKAWWYRREITLEDPLPAAVRLVFEGINYRANVWLNGQRVASDQELVGAFRIFDVDVRAHVRPGKNALAVEIHPPRPGDYTIGFVDWNPRPPDANMGLWRPVKLRCTGPVSLEDPFVETRLAPDQERAGLTIEATVVNRTSLPVSALVKGEVEGIGFSQKLALAAGERKIIRFTPQEFPALDLEKPRLWWPIHYGEPHLYTLRLEATVDKTASDARTVTFGVREVGDYINEEGHRATPSTGNGS